MIFDIKPLTIQDITAIINCAIVIFTVWYAYKQFLASKTSNIDNALIKTFEFLQNKDFILARRHVMKNLAAKQFSLWSADDIDYAETVCRNYDTAYLMNERLGYEENLREIAIKWNYSILNSYNICKPLIKQYQQQRGLGFWNHFDKLYEHAEKVKTDNTDNILS